MKKYFLFFFLLLVCVNYVYSLNVSLSPVANQSSNIGSALQISQENSRATAWAKFSLYNLGNINITNAYFTFNIDSFQNAGTLNVSIFGWENDSWVNANCVNSLCNGSLTNVVDSRNFSSTNATINYWLNVTSWAINRTLEGKNNISFALNATGGSTIITVSSLKLNITFDDYVPPTFDIGNNASTISKFNNSVLFRVNITDNVAISYSIFAWNDSGSWVNDSPSLTAQATPETELDLVPKNITSKRGSYVCGRFYANDSSNNFNVTDDSCFTVANTNPITPTLLTPVNLRWYNYLDINYTGFDVDNDIFSFKVWINDTINYTLTTNITNWNASDGAYRIKVNANDTGGGESSNTSQITFYLDKTPPYFIGFGNNASTVTKINNVVKWNLTLQDNLNLSHYRFAHNQSGALTNSSLFNLSKTIHLANQTLTVTLTRSKVLCGQFWFNDSAGNINTTNLSCFTVANTAPITPTQIYPNNGFASDINWTYLNFSSSDADSDTLTYFLYADKTTNPKTLVYNGTNTFFNLSNLSDGEIWYWKLQTHDSFENSSNSSIRSITASFSTPAINLLTPSTNSYYTAGTNVNLTFSVTDSNGIENCSLYINSTGNWENNQTKDVTSGINDFFNITLGNEKNYIWNVWCNDTTGSSSYAVSNYSFVLDTIAPSVVFNSPSGSYSSDSDIPFNVTVSDGYLIDSCWYNITTDAGTVETSTTSISCNSFNGTFNVAGGTDDYIFTTTANDTAGNINITTQSFSVSISTGTTTTSGGGGGGGETTKKDCNLTITPQNITFYKDVIVEQVIIKNNENNSISPTYLLNTELYEIRGAQEVILGLETVAFSILHKDLNASSNTTLIISSSTCNDEIINIFYSNENKGLVAVEQFLGIFEKKIVDTLLGNVNIYGNSIPFFVFTLLLLLFVVVSFKFSNISITAKILGGLFTFIVLNIGLAYLLPLAEADVESELAKNIITTLIESFSNVSGILFQEISSLSILDYTFNIYFIYIPITFILLSFGLLQIKTFKYLNIWLKILIFLIIVIGLSIGGYYILKYYQII